MFLLLDRSYIVKSLIRCHSNYLIMKKTIISWINTLLLSSTLFFDTCLYLYSFIFQMDLRLNIVMYYYRYNLLINGNIQSTVVNMLPQVTQNWSHTVNVDIMFVCKIHDQTRVLLTTEKYGR